jgi:hypothetical protein
MPVLITASTEEVGMGFVPEDRAIARSGVLGMTFEIGGGSPDPGP